MCLVSCEQSVLEYSNSSKGDKSVARVSPSSYKLFKDAMSPNSNANCCPMEGLWWESANAVWKLLVLDWVGLAWLDCYVELTVVDWSDS